MKVTRTSCNEFAGVGRASQGCAAVELKITESDNRLQELTLESGDSGRAYVDAQEFTVLREHDWES